MLITAGLRDMLYKFSLLALSIMTVVGLSGCTPKPSQTINTAVRTQGQGAVVLPSDWPIPELAPPANTTQNVVPSIYRRTKDNSTTSYKNAVAGGGYMWVVGFWGPISMEELEKYVDGILLPKGYSITETRGLHSVGIVTDTSADRTYTSSDRKTIVECGYRKYRGSILYVAYETYYFLVEVE